MSFLNFLKQTRQLLSWKANCGKLLYLVVGNESCDLDSAVCAITLAFLYKSTEKHANSEYLPVLNIPRRDYALKTEVQHLFQQVGIEPEQHLTFCDDLVPELLRHGHYILVDHHIPNAAYATRVDAVFDHRPYDATLDTLPAHCQRRIEAVGSCATLIAEQYFNENKLPTEDLSIAHRLLHSTIVLDTVNFSAQVKRATPKDHCMAERLEQCLLLLPPGATETKRTQIFDELVAARADCSQLNAEQLLRKDMKIIEAATDNLTKQRIALPGFPLLVQDFIKRTDAAAAVRQFASEQRCELVLLMGMYVQPATGSVQRDIGIIALTQDAKALGLHVQSTLLASQNPPFGLVDIDNVDFMQGMFYRQTNVVATRKNLLPLVKQQLDRWSSPKPSED